MHLYLHIGTAKTGTTTLQHFMYANRVQLAAQGVAVLDSAGGPNSSVLAAFSQPEDEFDHYFLRRGITSSAAKRRHFADFPARLGAEIAALPPHTRAVFASSENLHARLRDDASLRRLQQLLLQAGFTRITVLCYFREQSAQALSRYSTRLRGGERESLEVLLREYSEDSPLWNYEIACRRWADVFGRENLVARPFVLECFEGSDLRRDLLALLPEVTQPEACDFSDEPKNKGLGHVGLELARRLNDAIPRYTADGRNNSVRSRLYSVIAESALGRRGVTPFPQAAQIHGRFAASNTEFGRHFLGLKGNPFPLPAVPAPASVYPGGLSQSEQDLIAEAQSLFADTCALAAESPALDSGHADALKQLALRIARGEPTNAADAHLLLSLAVAINPADAALRQLLETSREKLENPVSASKPPSLHRMIGRWWRSVHRKR